MLRWININKTFPYPCEIPTIFSVIEQSLEQNKEALCFNPLLVDPFAFLLAVRRQEGGRKGCEFGIMHKDAYDTDLRTQAEWTVATLVKDTIRWHTNALICVQGKSKKDFVDFIEYFGCKYCPVGASNDPYGYNKYWIPNVRKFYEEYHL